MMALLHHQLAVYAGKLVAYVNVLLVIGVIIQRVLHHIQLKPQVVGDLLRIHIMMILQTGDVRYRNARALYAGAPAADERMRRDARRQLVKLDAFDMLADLRFWRSISFSTRFSAIT